MESWSVVADLFAWPQRAADYAELVDPLQGGDALRARIVATHDETAETRTLTLRPSREWRRKARPRPGQHVRVSLAIEGRRHTRTYSISSAPGRRNGSFTITVKATPGGLVSRHL